MLSTKEIKAINDRNKRVINNLHDLYKGERIFILGTGASLDTVTNHTFAELEKEYTFGVNTIITYNRLTFPLEFYCVSEVGWLADSNQPFNVHKGLEESGMLPGYRFYSHPFSMHEGNEGSQFYKKGEEWLEEIDDWVYVREDRDVNLQDGGGEFVGLGESFEYVPGGNGSVVLFAIQLSCWMGFSEVYLLGCDATIQGYAEGLNWEPSEPQRRRQDNFVRAAKVAEEEMGKYGRKLVNLAPGGNLTIQREKVEKVLNG